jgi:hypothetical protein
VQQVGVIRDRLQALANGADRAVHVAVIQLLDRYLHSAPCGLMCRVAPGRRAVTIAICRRWGLLLVFPCHR